MSLLDIIFDLPIVERILDRLIPLPSDDQGKPPCINLYWTMPDNIKVGKAGRMKPACELGQKTKPTCGGIYSDKPSCESYRGQEMTELQRICAWCKKDRDTGRQLTDEEYESTCTPEAEASHSICPECAAKNSPTKEGERW